MAPSNFVVVGIEARKQIHPAVAIVRTTLRRLYLLLSRRLLRMRLLERWQFSLMRIAIANRIGLCCASAAAAARWW